MTQELHVKSISVCILLALALVTGSARFAAAEMPAPVLGPAVSIESVQQGAPVAGGLGADALAPNAIVPTYTGCSTVVPAPVNAAWEQEVVELVNQQRQANGGLPPLKRVTALDSASRNHAVDMVADNYFQHDSYDRDAGGNLVLSCGWSTRVAGFYSGWSSLAENIAAGQSSPSAVMAAWMGSPGHRTNILSTSNWEVGVGYNCCGGTYSRYWVQDFGKRSNTYPLVIEREKASTNSQTVAIYIYGAFSEMRLKNDSGTFSAWQPFSNNFNWTLPGTPGNHTVYAEMRSGSTVRTADDSIQLNLSGTAVPTATNIPPTATGVPPTATNIPLPTATNQPPPTSTNLPLPTSTSVPLPTSTSLPPPTPTQSGGGQTLTFGAPHDAFVASNYRSSNFGSYGYMLVRGGSPQYRAFLKFYVTGINGQVASAKLRLNANDGSSNGGSLYQASNNYSSGSPWSESGVRWSNMPPLIGSPLASAGSVSTGSWVELDVTSTVSGNGTYSFGLVSSSSDQVGYRSSESSSNRPELVIQLAP